MQLQIVKRWPFIKKRSTTSTATTTLPSLKDIPSPKWYRSITELPLSCFIRVVVDENLHAIVISGNPDDMDLLHTWGDIQMQYADAMKDNEHKLMISLSREVQKLSITIDQIHIALDNLKHRYVKEFADRVNKWLQSSFKFDYHIPGDYDNDIERAYRRTKGLKLDLDLKLMAYDAMKTKFASSDKKFTREYFQGILITLSDHVKFPVTDSITVFEYCDRVRRLNEHIDYLKKQETNGRRQNR